MRRRRTSVLKLEEIIRFQKNGLSERQIAKALRCSRTTVKKCLRGDPDADKQPSEAPEPAWISRLNWDEHHSEILSGVPIFVLWEEGRESSTIPVNYSTFWKTYRKRYPELTASMHRIFQPGERAEIDYCDGIPMLDPLTGEIVTTQLFVGVLCHSRYVFAEFTLSQKSPDFLASHVRMLEYFGGTPQIVTPDNLKSAVTRVHRYDPDINPAYTRLAAHYDFAVVPAVVRSPKHKAIVERSCQIFQRWFYWRVRKMTFTSLVELNAVLKKYLKAFNDKVHRIFRKTRTEMFEAERAALRALPETAYSVAVSSQGKLHPDCHLVFDHNFYSAPHKLRGQVLTVWATGSVVEIFAGLERVACHGRAPGNGQFKTDNLHYPPAQQAYAEAVPSKVRADARRIGVNTAAAIDALFAEAQPLRYLRRAQGIVRLTFKYGPERLEKACLLARQLNQVTCRWIENILKRGLEEPTPETKPIQRGSNPHLRGAELLQ